ncbi:MAG: hypothetical protein C0423_19880 [Methylibium sp.]|nr:hypothetical protein [Methylibium sp.]
MSSSKQHDWMTRLNALVMLRLAEPFAWGRNDCGSFAADAALAMTGHDVLRGLRGPRRSERATLRQMRAAGGVSAVLAQAGLQRVDPALAQRGDVVLIDQGRGWPVLSICMGAHAVAPGPGGLEQAAMALAQEAWRL